MKKVFKIVLGFIVSIVLLISAIFMLTGGMPDAADEFLVSVKSKNIEKANHYLSKLVIEDSSTIIKYLQDNAFDEITDTTWNSRAFVNNKGHISGTVTINNQESIKTRMTFFKEDGDWKIYSIQKLRKGEGTNAQAPIASHQKKLVYDSMKSFVVSAGEKSMSYFYENISAVWKSQITVQKLDEIFGSIYQYQGDLTFLDNPDPIIDIYTIDENDILKLTGSFPGQNVSIYFNFKFIYEGTQWKLFGFEYSTKKPEQ